MKSDVEGLVQIALNRGATTVPEIERLTGKSPWQIRTALKHLEQQHVVRCRKTPGRADEWRFAA